MKWLKLLSCLLLFSACQNGSPEKNESTEREESVVRGEAQGTTYTVKYIAGEVPGLKAEMDALLKAIDQSMSTYVPNSIISKLNQGDTVLTDRLFRDVYQLSEEINRSTNGAFDPTIGPLIKAWGFDYSEPQKMDSVLVLQLLKSSGFNKFEMKKEGKLWRKNKTARINFNAIAQGYSVDLMCNIMDGKGIKDYYVELGGELKVKGKNRLNEWWIIGIDQPEGKNLQRKLAARVSLENAAMATSGNYRKYYEVDGKKYSHTLNPKTGYPAQNSLLSVTVVAKDGAMADAMATAFMVMGLEKTKEYLQSHREIQAHLIFADDKGEFETFTSSELKERLL